MKHTIEHDLDQATAKRVIDRAFASYKAQLPDYNPTLAWATDRLAKVAFSAKGVQIKGTMTVGTGEIVLDLDVPWLFRIFQGKAVGIIDREVRVWIAKAKAGEV